MSKQPKVSIIVPIYGVEKYLKQCVDSILAQTLQDIEVILVDDGSPDKCPQIIDEYAKSDKRVVAIHQPNGGYGVAVNHGISVATGEYIGIIESDDWIEPNMYQELYKNAHKNNTDITKGGFYKYDSTLPAGQQDEYWYNRYQDLKDAPSGVFSIEEYPLLASFHASIWSSIYKSDFIKQQQVNESRSASYQDFPFMIEAVCRANRITVDPRPFVHYRMETGQNSSTMRNDKRLILMADQCLIGRDILHKYNKYETLKEEFYFHAFLANHGFFHCIQKQYQREYFNHLKKLFAPLKKDKNFKWKYFDAHQKSEALYWMSGTYNKYMRARILKFIFSCDKDIKSHYIKILGLKIRF